MNAFTVFGPHLLGCIGAFIWLLASCSANQHGFVPMAFESLVFYTLLYVLLIGLTPSDWLRASPTENQQADVAIILNFGYEHNGTNMKPGDANLALLRWVLNNKGGQVKTLLMQEGVWVAVDEQTLMRLGIQRLRLHRHDPIIYVNTLNVAFCALQLLRKLDKKNVLLVAHDLQLQRAAWDFQKVAQVVHPDCTLLIPDIRNIPYPANSVQWHTRNGFVFKIIELLIARPRDFLSRIPNECIAPNG